MATELLAIGSTAAVSTEFTVDAFLSVTVALKDVTDYPTVRLQMKDDAGSWSDVDHFGVRCEPIVISGAGTYRLSRAAGSHCGAYRV